MPRLHDQALALLLGAGTTTTIEAAALLLKEVKLLRLRRNLKIDAVVGLHEFDPKTPQFPQLLMYTRLIFSHSQVQMVENLLVNVLLTADGLKKSIERSQYISEANALLCEVTPLLLPPLHQISCKALQN